VLERNRLSPKSFETGIRNDLLVNRTVDALGFFTGISATEIDHWIEYIDQEIKIVYATVKSSDYEAQVKVADEELHSWYANVKQQYKTPPQSKLHYLSFPFADDLHQVAVSEEAIRTYYKEHADTYSSPEQRRARHILFKVTDADPPEAKATKKAAAEKVLAQIAGGSDFAQLARQFSEDTSKDKGGDLGLSRACFRFKKEKSAEWLKPPLAII
jgi:peptidyl-prolyl cis-trans isomerase D